jgi:hypothetical protein
MTRSLLLALLLLIAACDRKPHLVEALSLPDSYTLSMERLDPNRPLFEFVASPDPAMSSESVFLHHPTWKAREGIPIGWNDIKAECRLYQTPATIFLTTKRQIAWRVPGIDGFYWNKWELDLDQLPTDQEAVFRDALYSVGHLPYEIAEFDLNRRRCVLRLTHPSLTLPPRLTFQFQSTAKARNGSNIAGGSFVFEGHPNK